MTGDLQVAAHLYGAVSVLGQIDVASSGLTSMPAAHMTVRVGTTSPVLNVTLRAVTSLTPTPRRTSTLRRESFST